MSTEFPRTDESTADVTAKTAIKNIANDAATQTPGWERSVLEKLACASLNEQRAARRWKIGLRIAWLVLLASLVWALMHTNASDKGGAASGAHTATVRIRGDIAQGAEASADNILAAVKSAMEDKGSKAVVLLIDSGGGSPVQAGIVYDELRRMKAKYNKPLYAVVEETCASAAYYIASATDQIYADKASIVGSIGVLMDSFGVTGLMDKLGVERRLMTAGQNKGFLDPFSPQTAEQKAYAQKMLDIIHAQFIQSVRQGRGTRLKETPETFSGLFWTGQQALDMGLIDGLSNIDQLARDVVKAEEVVDYTRSQNVAERLAKKFGAAVGEGAMKAARELPTLR